MNTPTISILIPWCDRPEVGVALARHSKEFDAISAEVLIVNCGGDPRCLREALATIRVNEVRILHLSDARFNKPLALNIGAVFSRSARLFLLDADVILEPNILTDALHLVGETRFVTIARVDESDQSSESPEETTVWVERIEIADDKTITMKRRMGKRRITTNKREGSGLVLLTKEHFTSIRGMNSEMLGCGWEDIDFLLRLMAALSLEKVSIGRATHLTHGDGIRYFAGETKADSRARNLAIAFERYSRHDFFGTLKEDEARWKHRVVETVWRQ